MFFAMLARPVLPLFRTPQLVGAEVRIRVIVIVVVERKAGTGETAALTTHRRFFINRLSVYILYTGSRIAFLHILPVLCF